MSRYINPYTDFGFKRLFGREANQDLLIDFLNTLLPKKHQIKTLKFRDPEHLGETPGSRRAVFDVFCEAKNGEQFIVEMQKEDQEFFKDRSLYYVAHPIREQGQRGKNPKTKQVWNYELKPVYLIAILDFIYDKNDPNPVLIREVSLKDQHGKEFYEKLQLIYIQMPLFDLEESELVTRRDKWLYFLKHLPSLEHIPAIMKEKVFAKAFLTAEISAMSQAERDRYDHEWNDYLTYMATLETAEKKGKSIGQAEGHAEGRAEGEIQKAIEIARNMKMKGLDTSLIAELTGLLPGEIERLE